MSKLNLFTSQKSWDMNVISFSSPIYGTISSAQTKTMAHHYPVRCDQPEINLSVVFVSEREYEDFQRFVRAHQQETLLNAKLVFLNWPERNINHWTGVIKNFKAGGMRRNPAPHASFTVDLVDSMVSARTDLASLPGLLWQNIYGAGMGPDAVLGLPTAAENELVTEITGTDLFGNRPVSGIGNGAGAPMPNFSQPGFGPSGITAGG